MSQVYKEGLKFSMQLLVLLAGLFALVLKYSFLQDTPSPVQMRKAEQACQEHLLQLKNRRYLTLIDYTQSVLATRLWVVDRYSGEVVLRTHVAHAFNSGLLHATKFSNANGSKKSCFGTFVTRES